MMDNNACFPAGLRVLVIDDDPTWLRIAEKMLKKCSYEVTTCGLAREALKLLHERKDGYDIVLCEVKLPDMDGFKFLELVGLDMDLPIIMMSVDGETSRVMKGVKHGACDYLLKPIRMKELRNIWQHVFRKKINEARDIEILEGVRSTQTSRIESDNSNSINKRKDVESKHDGKDLIYTSSAKKARVVWSVDLHQKFVEAVNQIGLDKVGPKKILDAMNVPWLTRENVATHLQKYRLYLSRLHKESEEYPLLDETEISSNSKIFSSSPSNQSIPSYENKQKSISYPSPTPKRTSTSDVSHSSKSEHFLSSSSSESSEESFAAAFDSTFLFRLPRDDDYEKKHNLKNQINWQKSDESEVTYVK